MAVILNSLLRNAPFKKCARIYSGRGVALKVNKVARLIAICGVEKVVITDLKQGRQRRVRGDMATNAGIFLVLAMHHGHGVPADQALDAALQRAITGIRRFLRYRNSVHIGSIQLDRHVHARQPGALGKSIKQPRSLTGAFLVYDLIKGLNPLHYFFIVRFNCCGGFGIHIFIV